MMCINRETTPPTDKGWRYEESKAIIKNLKRRDLEDIALGLGRDL